MAAKNIRLVNKTNADITLPIQAERSEEGYILVPNDKGEVVHVPRHRVVLDTINLVIPASEPQGRGTSLFARPQETRERVQGYLVVDDEMRQRLLTNRAYKDAMDAGLLTVQSTDESAGTRVCSANFDR